jgi:hypothetical protein
MSANPIDPTPNTAPQAILKPSKAVVFLAREKGVDPSAFVEQVEQVERAALIEEIKDRYYRHYLLTLTTGITPIRHHLRPGEAARTRSERRTDRKSWGAFKTSAERALYQSPATEDEVSTYAPSKPHIYPSRVTHEDMEKYREKQTCSWCGFIFKGREDAVYCGPACRMAEARAKAKR